MALHDTDGCDCHMLSDDEREKSTTFFITSSPQRQHRHRIISKLFPGLALIVIFLLSIAMTFLFIIRTHAPGIIESPCGNSSSEAKARGCHFDVLSFCWVPEECFDRELTEEFRKAGPWTFYTDMNKTATVTEEQFSSNTQHVYLTNRLHKAHCAYNILRFHKALTDGRMVRKEDVLAHTKHCTLVLTEINEPNDIEVRARIQYPDCGHFSTSFPGKEKDRVLSKIR
ncbi:hypothetical protein LY78DRAFT_731604 [Colletotrichum sublineola]|nr:hypothetical protein LY78DRAFT_731604 [Colletotrichum sublineola]